MSDDNKSFAEKVDEEGSSFKKDRISTQVLINTANTIDNADGNVVTALYEPLQLNLGFNTEQLGAITTARALLQAVSSPIWGWFSDRFSRKLILAIGCLIWGVFTIILGFMNTFWGMFFVRALTGLGLAVIFPTAQSLIADYFPKSKRGQAFGYLGLTTVLGAIVGTLYATLFSETTVGPLEGWQFVFITIGAFSILLGVCVFIFSKDPIRGQSDDLEDSVPSEGNEEKLVEMEEKPRRKFNWGDYKTILSNKTFLLVVLQGVAGTIPWNSILFIVFWLEEIGFEPFLAGISFSMVAIGAAFGNLFGGIIGDRAAKWNPDKGRIMVAQISVFSGIPMMFIIFYIIPHFALGQLTNNNLLILFIAIGIFTGFLISWSGPATNNPIFSELFIADIRSSAFAVDRLFEGSIAASGTYLVALFANRVFGYSNEIWHKGSLSNIIAMSNALLICTIVPWTICLLVYSFVYFTYPKDRVAAIQKRTRKEIH
ncbi:MAG: MFS transporter [Candidatus Heimdallarchaeota archaeon]